MTAKRRSGVSESPPEVTESRGQGPSKDGKFERTLDNVCFDMLRAMVEKRGEENIPARLKELRDEGLKLLNK